MDGLIRYSCSQCAEQPYLYQALGHDGPPQNYYDKNAVTGELLQECPVMTMLKAPPDILAELQRMELEYYPLFQSGFLLESGGVMDQPSRYLDWMRHFGEMKRAVQHAYDIANAPKGG